MRKLIMLLAALSFTASGCNAHTGATKTTVVKKPEGKDLQRVVVLEFAAEGIEKNEASGLESYFCNELFNTPGIELFCPGDLNSIVELKELQTVTGEYEESTSLSKIAEKTKAHRVITGKISKVGKMFVVNVNIADGDSGQVTTRIQQQVDSENTEDIMPAMKEAARKAKKEL